MANGNGRDSGDNASSNENQESQLRELGGALPDDAHRTTLQDENPKGMLCVPSGDQKRLTEGANLSSECPRNAQRTHAGVPPPEGFKFGKTSSYENFYKLNGKEPFMLAENQLLQRNREKINEGEG